jgi:hypothetical protein
MQQTTWQEIQDIAKERDGVIYRLGYESAIGLKTTELKMAKDNLSVILNDKIKLLLSQQRKEIVEWIKQLVGKHNARILNEFQKQGTADMPLIAYDERVCLIPAIALAMKETDDDIITKLSSEEV